MSDKDLLRLVGEFVEADKAHSALVGTKADPGVIINAAIVLGGKKAALYKAYEKAKEKSK